MRYTVWIEAEDWVPHEWMPIDANTDVVVTLASGEQWGASFISYQNIRTFVARFQQTGECLSGAYFWSSDMILIDEVSRSHIEAVIYHLMQTGEFSEIFTCLPHDERSDAIAVDTMQGTSDSVQ